MFFIFFNSIGSFFRVLIEEQKGVLTGAQKLAPGSQKGALTSAQNMPRGHKKDWGILTCPRVKKKGGPTGA